MNLQPFPEWILWHLPHDSTVIPTYVRSQFALDDDELARELVRMTDHHTLDLFTAGIPEERIVRAPVSRLVIDVERFEDDRLEPMSARGMGVVYERTADGKSLRHPLSAGTREILLRDWYRPHHERLAAVTQRVLDQHGRALWIDAHSFPSRPLPYEQDQRTERPEICIGTDDFHTPPLLEQAFLEAFRVDGFDVRLNAPFAGALVPLRYYRTDQRIAAVMVEINRGLYLEESSGERCRDFPEVAARIRNCIAAAVRAFASSTFT